MPVGGHNITKDISQILELDLERSEREKRNFDQNLKSSDYKDASIDILQKIIFARTEEILELCEKINASDDYFWQKHGDDYPPDFCLCLCGLPVDAGYAAALFRGQQFQDVNWATE